MLLIGVVVDIRTARSHAVSDPSSTLPRLPKPIAVAADAARFSGTERHRHRLSKMAELENKEPRS